MSGPTLTLVRHGLTQWARDGRYTGRTDLPLLPEGEQQAHALSAVLSERQYSLVLTSPLERARHTAQLAGFPDAVDDGDLMEWDYGDAEGADAVEWKRAHPEFDQWHVGTPHGESPQDVGARVDRVIARTTATDGNVLVFAHGHVLDVLAVRWIGLDPSVGGNFQLDPATISELGWHHDRPVMVRWNCPGGGSK